jgi:peptidoglycan hydrolase-like protein with peptidoglycan-binding domain
MKRSLRRRVAVAALLFIAATACTAEGRPPSDQSRTGASGPTAPTPKFELPSTKPSCIWHGLSFGRATLENNRIAAENVRTSVGWSQAWLGILASETGGTPGLPITGRFDEATEAAVKRFQATLNLTPDGLVGRETWQALGGAVNGCQPEGAPSCDYAGAPVGIDNVDATKNPVGAEDVRPDVLQWQRWWNGVPAERRGSTPDLTLPETGYIDAATDAAIAALQAASGLTADRFIGPATWRALGSAAGVCGA